MYQLPKPLQNTGKTPLNSKHPVSVPLTYLLQRQEINRCFPRNIVVKRTPKGSSKTKLCVVNSYNQMKNNCVHSFSPKL